MAEEPPTLLRRRKLHQILVDILGTDQVHFQRPVNTQMSYPAIVYSPDNDDVSHADNLPYMNTKRYQVTVMDWDPDSVIAEKVASLPSCETSQKFARDKLNHFVYTLNF